jgi:hypothetical protein
MLVKSPNASIVSFNNTRVNGTGRANAMPSDTIIDIIAE